MFQKAIQFSLVLVAGSGIAQTPDPAAALAAIKDYALNYTQSLPNYTAKQLVQRRVKPTTQGRFTTGTRAQTDTVEEQIGYVDHRELHKLLTVNGQAVKEGDNEQSGMFSRGEFALLLDTIFRPETKATFRWDRMAKLNGRRVSVFEFQVPQLPNGYGIQEGSRTLIVPYKGSFFADAETKAVMRIHIVCSDIPSVSTIKHVELTLDYKALKVAGQEYILPSHYTMNLRRLDADISIDATYRNYQRFAADATIIFDEEQPQ
jgi:hypothetical protein